MSSQQRRGLSPLVAFLVLAASLIVLNLAAYVLVVSVLRAPQTGSLLFIGTAVGIFLTLCLLGAIDRLPGQQFTQRSERDVSPSPSPQSVSQGATGARPETRPHGGAGASVDPRLVARPADVQRTSAEGHGIGSPAQGQRGSEYASTPLPAGNAELARTFAAVVPGETSSDATLDRVLRASQAMQQDLQRTMSSLDELRRELASSTERDWLPALREQQEATLAHARQVALETADVQAILTTKLDQIIEHQRTLLVRRARKLAMEIHERGADAREALGASSADLLQVLASFRESYGTNFTLLNGGVDRLVDEVRADRELRAAWRGAEQLTETANLEAQVLQLLDDLMAGRITLAQAEQALEDAADHYGRIADASLPLPADLWVEPLRRRLIAEIDAEYLAFVQGRTSYTSSDPLSKIMRAIGLELIEIRLGETTYNPTLHDAIESTRDERFADGSIANLVAMGYRDMATGQIVKAKVYVNRS